VFVYGVCEESSKVSYILSPLLPLSKRRYCDAWHHTVMLCVCPMH